MQRNPKLRPTASELLSHPFTAAEPPQDTPDIPLAPIVLSTAGVHNAGTLVVADVAAAVATTVVADVADDAAVGGGGASSSSNPRLDHQQSCPGSLSLSSFPEKVGTVVEAFEALDITGCNWAAFFTPMTPTK